MDPSFCRGWWIQFQNSLYNRWKLQKLPESYPSQYHYERQTLKARRTSLSQWWLLWRLFLWAGKKSLSLSLSPSQNLHLHLKKHRSNANKNQIPHLHLWGNRNKYWARDQVPHLHPWLLNPCSLLHLGSSSIWPDIRFRITWCPAWFAFEPGIKLP